MGRVSGGEDTEKTRVLVGMVESNRIVHPVLSAVEAAS